MVHVILLNSWMIGKLVNIARQTLGFVAEISLQLSSGHK